MVVVAEDDLDGVLSFVDVSDSVEFDSLDGSAAAMVVFDSTIRRHWTGHRLQREQQRTGFHRTYIVLANSAEGRYAECASGRFSLQSFRVPVPCRIHRARQ